MIAKKRIIALLLSVLILLTVITPIPVFAEEQEILGVSYENFNWRRMNSIL